MALAGPTAPGQCLPVAPDTVPDPVDDGGAPYPDASGHCPTGYATTATVKYCVRTS
jgi:hypothetical protein